MSRILDLTGREIGYLVVLEQGGRDGRRVVWLCTCICGKIIRVRSTALVEFSKGKVGKIMSCGCRQIRNTTHNKSYTKIYKVYTSMLQRCYNPNSQKYLNYGARGIKVCLRWRASVENFIQDMGPKPYDYMSLDRIDVNDDYKPENCKWSTPLEQTKNRRKTSGCK